MLPGHGKGFADCICVVDQNNPIGKPVFDKSGASRIIMYHLINSWYLQTNGMMKQCSGRMADILDQSQFCCTGHLKCSRLKHIRFHYHYINNFINWHTCGMGQE